MKKPLLLLLLIALITANVYPQNITRKAFMGLKFSEINDSIKNALNLKTNEGIAVTSVTANSTADKIGVKVNDVLKSVNGSKTYTVKDYRDAIKNLREKSSVSFILNRDGNTVELSGSAEPLPYEKSVKFKDGYLRIIVTKPKSEGKFKTILFIPGYMCYSLDNIGKHPYGQVVEKLSERGYSVVRVEKPAMGDCFNTPDCFEIDYSTELEAFEAGFQKMITYDFVDKDNVYIFGHSLGGYEAPMVDKNRTAKGIIVCGTGLKTWYEYIIEMFRFQNPIAGVDYLENEKVVTDMIKILYDYLVLKKTPQEIAVTPEIKKVMMDYMEYDGNNQVWSRHYKFWQELNDLNMPLVWKNVKANVLIIRGEGDFEAFSNREHEDIEKIVNTYNPGKAKFVLIPNMDHGFATAKTPEESFRNKSIPGYYYNNFNDEVINVISDWIEGLK